MSLDFNVMKLCTLNCHSWQEENQLEKISYLARIIHEKQYDAIALQEVSQLIDAPVVKGNIKVDNFGLLLLKELAALGSTEYNLIWDFAHIGYEIYEEGLAILTKHPVMEEHSFFVSKSKNTNFWKTRKVVGATISYNGSPYTIFSCHLGWWADDDEPFSHQVTSLLQQVDDKGCTFLMGDFNNNASEKGEGYDLLRNHGLYDTYELATERDNGMTVTGKIAGWEKNKQDLRLDLILTNQAVHVLSSRVIFNGMNKEVVSDHYGVEVIVRVD